MKNMNFECKQIEINDEELGCTLTFIDREEVDMETRLNMTFNEIIESIGQYVLLQRTYPEDEYENDYYYIESSNENITGELEDFKIKLDRSKFLLIIGDHRIEIDLKTDDQQFNELKEILEIIVNERGELIINE